MATTPTRFTAAQINGMPMEDCELFEPFTCPVTPVEWRISDCFLGKIYAYCAIVRSRKFLTTKLAPITFTKKSMTIRTTGKVIGLGNAFIYKGKYVTFCGYVLRGAWQLDLEVGLPLESLVEDADFQQWIRRSFAGDFAAFTPEVLRTNIPLITSITSPDAGMIGSPARAYMGIACAKWISTVASRASSPALSETNASNSGAIGATASGASSPTLSQADASDSSIMNPAGSGASSPSRSQRDASMEPTTFGASSPAALTTTILLRRLFFLFLFSYSAVTLMCPAVLFFLSGVAVGFLVCFLLQHYDALLRRHP
ncbi:hypothetical protein VE04_01552 [Pseudogymnoascus sp. 24MN13]|nr:hypothetical protein VE04_01543 [Pseudogymnoascus sp. 24MN13]OBT58276.1 hypothetical protein VE04_01552 [Pseudogymnoascus sp. 24MN13]